MVVTLTCTDRNGRRLDQIEVKGRTFHSTFKARGEVYQRWIEQHSDAVGRPYIFSSTNNANE